MTEPITKGRQDMLRLITVDDVNGEYHKGYITAGQRNRLMTEKAHSNVAEMIEKHGDFLAVYKLTIKHIQEGWNNVVEAAKRPIPADLKTASQHDLYYWGQAIWGQIQILTAPFTAIGEVTGQMAENQALKTGASPGLARVINIATDVSTGFIPVGAASKSFVKGVQGVQNIGKAKAVEGAKKLAGAEGVQDMARALVTGLELDGVQEAAPAVAAAVEAATGMPRRDFLRAMGLAATVGPSVLAGVGKAGNVAEVVKTVADVVAPKVSSIFSRLFTFGDSEAAIYKLTDGNMLLIEDIDRSGIQYNVLNKKGKSLGRLEEDDFIKFMEDTGEPFLNLSEDIPPKLKKIAEDIGPDLIKMVKGEEFEIAQTMMSVEQELWFLAKRDRIGGIEKAAKQFIEHYKDRIKEDKEMLEKIKAGTADKWSMSSEKRYVAQIKENEAKIERYSPFMGTPKKAGEPKGTTPKETEAERLFPDPKEEAGAEVSREKLKSTPTGMRSEGVVNSPPPPLSVQEQFQLDLTKFRKTMGSLTETQTHQQTQAMANKLGLTLDDLRNVNPGAAMDEKQMLAYLNALDPMANKLVELARAAVTGGEAELNAMAKFASEFFTLAPIFRGAEITAGRSVEILKETPPMKKITEMLTGWDPEALAKGDWHGAVKTMAEDLVSMADNAPDKIAALAIQYQSWYGKLEKKWWPMAREAYINLYLARPITQVRNFAGNTVSTTNALLERFTGSMFSADRKNGLVGLESWHLLKGMTASIADATKAFGQAYKGIDVSLETRLDFRQGAIPGVVGRITRIPGDTARGMDNFFKIIMRRGSYYAEAYRDGVHAGKEGKELADFVARRSTNPTHNMIVTGDEFALHNTFQDDLGKLGAAVRAVGQVGPLVLWFPFMKTPINLAKYAWNRTPGLQLISKTLYQDIAAGGPKADLAIGRLTIANLQGMFIYNLAQEGLITGSGPVDPQLRRVWLATHQPYSIRTPKGWMPITDAEPGTTPLGLVADFAQILNQLDEPSAEQGAMAITFVLLKGLADKTYWRTASDLVDVVSGVALGHESGTRGRDVLMAPVTSVLTLGPLGAGAARAVDPIQRETRSYMDLLQSKIPGYSKTLPPVRDWTGEPVLPIQAVGGPWVGLASPLRIKPETTDRVKLEGDRLEIKVPKFPWSVGGTARDDFDIRAPRPEDRIGVELTPQQRDTWQRMYKQLIRHPEFGIEKMLLNNPIYNKNPKTGEPTPPALQREIFMGVLADYRSTARDALTINDTDLGKKIIESQARHFMPMLTESQQPEAQGAVQQGLRLFDGMAPEMKQNLLRWGITDPGMSLEVTPAR